jgi:integrase
MRHRDLQADERVRAGDLWEEHGLVFTTQHGRPIEPRYLNTHFDRIRTAVGLPTVRLHDFRHTAVSLLLELGTPPHVVQAIARHADLDVTMRIYAHTNLDSMREAVDKIDWGAA